MKQRQTELDILRFLALLCVVGLHVDSGIWSSLEILTSDWIVATLYRVTWAVPIFVMISGRFFLDPNKDITFSAIYHKYILRLLTAILFWGVVYQIYYWGQGSDLNWKGFLSEALQGAYHMWYLWMLIGLYAIIPILRELAQDSKLTWYFIGLYFIVQCLSYFGRDLPLIGSTIGNIMDTVQLKFVGGYTAYYLLGYQLYRWQPTKKQEVLLYTAGILITVLSPAANIWLASRTGVITEYFTKYEAPTTFIQAAALYTFFAKQISKVNWKSRTKKFFFWTTKYGFGAYLIHALVNSYVPGLLDFLSPSLGLWLPLTTLAVTVVSFISAFLLHNIPLVGKYIA